MIKKTLRSLQINRRDVTILIGLSLLVLIFSIPGITWGAPDIWHPDEIVKLIAFSADKSPAFDQTNLTYPSLPKFIMLTFGKILLTLGNGPYTIIVVSRLFSSFLGILIVWVTYFITRKVTSNHLMSLISSLFVISNTEFLINSRFAHNDMYLMLFLILSVFFLILFIDDRKKYWLFTSFAMIGFAAASKYNGGALILAPIIICIVNIQNWNIKTFLMHVWILVQGGLIALGAYVLGNPIIFMDPAKYFTNLVSILKRHAIYNLQPGDTLGFFGQWDILRDKTLGTLIFYLFMISLIYVSLRIVTHILNIYKWNEKKMSRVKVIILAIILYDIPIMLSYNYQSRFFLFLIPLFSILAAILIEEINKILIDYSQRFFKSMFALIIIISIGFSGLRAISTTLLFVNDARIPASDYISELPRDLIVEYTTYHPRIPEGRFFRSHDYPLVFIKFKNQEIEINDFYEINSGAKGVDYRNTNILIIDSFVANRFENDYRCQLNYEDCIFFKDLFNGNTKFELLKTFDYSVPSYLPEIEVSFTNPDIFIFLRKDN